MGQRFRIIHLLRRKGQLTIFIDYSGDAGHHGAVIAPLPGLGNEYRYATGGIRVRYGKVFTKIIIVKFILGLV